MIFCHHVAKTNSCISSPVPCVADITKATVFCCLAQMQAIEQILKNSEKNLGEICTILASYTRKTAKLRDKADLLVATLFDFSHTEDPEFQIGLKNLAEDLAMVQDYRHAQVRG
ncbi:hypothetical protein GOODEAATRI_013419 [Goodea atripinnis]|uniref:CYRIA/CYRIB Rac1 binding domain-containing protein n=1 Tax=Goodea atripinnis TaxID=208336 RepID=A0ABV0NJW6_9TELE